MCCWQICLLNIGVWVDLYSTWRYSTFLLNSLVSDEKRIESYGYSSLWVSCHYSSGAFSILYFPESEPVCFLNFLNPYHFLPQNIWKVLVIISSATSILHPLSFQRCIYWFLRLLLVVLQLSKVLFTFFWICMPLGSANFCSFILKGHFLWA